jgi:WD40 repeat protein
MWNAETGTLLATLQGHQDRISSVTFSPDGKHLLTTSADGTARIWDAKTTEIRFVLRGHKGTVWNAAFSPDNRRLVTGGDDGTTRLWDAQTGESIAVMESHRVRGSPEVAFSSDSRRILTKSWGIGPLRLWDGRTGERIAQLEQDAFGAVFSPDGKRIVTTAGRQQRLWDAASGEEIASFRVEEVGPYFTEFSPDGRLVLITTRNGGPARVWQLPPTGQSLIAYARRIIPRQRTPE